MTTGTRATSPPATMPVSEPARPEDRPQQMARPACRAASARPGRTAADRGGPSRRPGGISDDRRAASGGRLRLPAFAVAQAADAEDLTQEVFLRSYVGHARFESTVMIRPWLLGIARNLLREHAQIKRRKEVGLDRAVLRLEEDLLEFETHTYEDVMVHCRVL